MAPSKNLPQVLIIIPQAEGNYQFVPNSVFWRSNFSTAERGVGLWSWIMEIPKLNLRGYWSHVLINSNIFATFRFLVPILFCNNLTLRMLKCVGSLTKLITFSLKSIVCSNNYMKYTTLSYPIFNHFTHHMPN